VKIVRLVWVDSTQLEHGAWMDVEMITEQELAKDALLQESVGYLVAESNAAVAIAASRNASLGIEDRNGTRFADVVVIPRQCVVEWHGLVDEEE
jgi:hypothetical protein